MPDAGGGEVGVWRALALLWETHRRPTTSLGGVPSGAGLRASVKQVASRAAPPPAGPLADAEVTDPTGWAAPSPGPATKRKRGRDTEGPPPTKRRAEQPPVAERGRGVAAIPPFISTPPQGDCDPRETVPH